MRSKSSTARRPRPLGFSKTRRTRGLVIAVFGRGDVVSMPLDPAMGHEQKGTRPALVLNTKEFNRLGDMLVAPITQGGEFSRYAGFAVSLMGTGCRTQGVALLNKTDCSTSRQEKRKKLSEHHKQFSMTSCAALQLCSMGSSACYQLLMRCRAIN